MLISTADYPFSSAPKAASALWEVKMAAGSPSLLPLHVPAPKM